VGGMVGPRSGGPREVWVVEMNPGGWGKRQRPVRQNRANVIPDLVDDDLVIVAGNPKTIHKELTLTTLMVINNVVSIAAVNEEARPVKGPAKIISEAATDD
jgi:hypothetical protein